MQNFKVLGVTESSLIKPISYISLSDINDPLFSPPNNKLLSNIPLRQNTISTVSTSAKRQSILLKKKIDLARNPGSSRHWRKRKRVKFITR